MPGGTVDQLIEQGLLPANFGTGGGTGDQNATDIEVETEEEEAEEEDRTFRLGGAFQGDLLATEFINEFDVIDAIGGQVKLDLIAWGKKNGESKGVMSAFFASWQEQMNNLLNGIVQQSRPTSIFLNQYAAATGEPIDIASIQGTTEYYMTSAGLNEMVDRAWAFYQGKDSRIGDRLPRTGSGGGGGSTRPSPNEIRQQFDLDQLANMATSIWQGLRLDEHPDPRGVAHDYVEAVVATHAEQKIDFATFVRSRAEETARFASIYANKPPEMSPEQYLGRYFEAAGQVARPGAAADIAIGGAQFGASAADFAARLGRTNENVTSAPFIAGMQGVLTDLKGLFKE